MTSCKNVARIATAVLLLSLPFSVSLCWGTTVSSNGYTYTSSINGINVLNSTVSPYSTFNCVSEGCIVDTYDGTHTFSSFAADENSHIWGVTSGGDTYYLSAPQTYTKWGNTIANTTMVSVASGGPDTTTGDYVMSITTAASGNTYYWNGTSNTQMGAAFHCDEPAVDDQDNMYCLGDNSDVYQWGSSTWTKVYNGGDAETISAANGTLMILTSASKFYTYINGTLSSSMTISAFTPADALGSMRIAFDGSIIALDASSNAWVSEDSGSTWSQILNAASIAQVATGGAGLHMVLGDAGHIKHINSVLQQTTVTVTGSCTASACSTNPNVAFTLYLWAPNATSTSYVGGSGTTGDYTCGTWGPGPGPYCQTATNTAAHTSVNYFVSATSTTCDQFANGSSNAQCQTSLALSVVDSVTLAVLLSETENCDCAGKPAWYNQKYKITSSTTGAPSKSKWFGSVTSTYYWKNVSMSQWCVTAALPDLSLFPTGVTIEYQKVGAAPTAMPGAYINGDVRAWQSRDTTARLISFLIYALTGQVMIYNSASDFGPTTFDLDGGIYTWDGTTAKRGAGGNPTTVCQGY